jgi:hypothetical protein
MTDNNIHDWTNKKDQIISILEDTVTVLDDISNLFQNYYPSEMSDFCYLCYGYIIISKHNIITSLFLLRNKMIYQVHYFSRNMFEMMTNLTYITDDKSKLEERIKRFFDYEKVQLYNQLKPLKEIPELFPFRNETEEINVQNDYNNYMSLYYNKKNSKRIGKWSGLNLKEMINLITDERKRNHLLMRYNLMTQLNNQYVHPSIEYIKGIIREEYGLNDKYGEKDQMAVYLLQSIYMSISMIISLYVEQFLINDHTIINKCYELEKRFRNIPSRIVS